jgi:hypothetical protein
VVAAGEDDPGDPVPARGLEHVERGADVVVGDVGEWRLAGQRCQVDDGVHPFDDPRDPREVAQVRLLDGLVVGLGIERLPVHEPQLCDVFAECGAEHLADTPCRPGQEERVHASTLTA